MAGSTSPTLESLDTESNAAIDNEDLPPVLAPARNASKHQHYDGVDGEAPGLHNPHILARLFDPDRKQKPQIWSHIRLVAPGPADQPPAGQVRWRSRDAVAAYCLKCKIQFTYSKGTSKTVSRHMQAYHGLVLKHEDGVYDYHLKRPGIGGSSAPLKKRKAGQDPMLAILRWVVLSYQPWNIVESAGFAGFGRTLSYTTPTKDDILTLAADQMERIKVQVRRLTKECDTFSVVAYSFENSGKKYTSVLLSFLTDTMDVNLLCLGILPGTFTTVALNTLLGEYSLPLLKMTHMVVTEDLEGKDYCILRSLNGCVKRAISPMDSLSQIQMETIPQYYQALQADPSNVLYLTVSSLLKPFYDAYGTLSDDVYATIGLATSVIRRIRDVLNDVETHTSLNRTVKENLTKELSATYDHLLNDTPTQIWAMPLDIRLVHMGGLSDFEQKSVKDALEEKVAALKLASMTEQKAEKKAGGTSSTMDGIFWNNQESEAKKKDDAASYAKTNVEHYFSEVKTKNNSSPFIFWRDHGDTFPELRTLARQWLATTVVGPVPDSRNTFAGEQVEMMVFLHDNAHLLPQSGSNGSSSSANVVQV